MEMSRKMNNMAVSPIVATLVLIVVAVVGAVAVGTIMGTFPPRYRSRRAPAQASSASQTELLTAGSTTVYPASLQIAKMVHGNEPWHQDHRPGRRVRGRRCSHWRWNR